MFESAIKGNIVISKLKGSESTKGPCVSYSWILVKVDYIAGGICR